MPTPMQAPSRAFTRRLRTAGAVLALALAAGCATVEPLQTNLRAGPARDCARWFQALDGAVAHAGVQDASAHRIAGFPYLRINRFLASFREQAAGDDQAFALWATRLAELDAGARRAELGNLPQQSLASLPAPSKEAAMTRTEQCANQLMELDLSNAAQRRLLLDRAHVPDHYATWKRILGLYALTAIPFRKGITRWQEQTKVTFQQTAAGAGNRAELVGYVPTGPAVTPEQVAAILEQAQPDALGIPHLTPEQREELFQAFAPAFEIETTGSYDRFGPLAWHAGPSPDVDISRPLAYRRLAYTRFAGRVRLQLVYTIWFPERPLEGRSDLLGGRLDGVVWRVTLDERGRALVYDSIHPCGCYHTFFPTALLQPVPPLETGIEWAFVPLELPALEPAQRVAVRIATRTHYVVGVRPDGDANGISYGFAEDDALRALPLPEGGTRSAFGRDGIVPGTQRGERWLFWPMGIAQPGSMREWGTHATAFVGRRHFDDADLIQRRFVPAPGP
jgi:hypothetical protein